MNECVCFTRDEVVVHNSQEDIWVIANGLMYDLTNLNQKQLETMTDVSSLNTTRALTVIDGLSCKSFSFPQSLLSSNLPERT